MEESLLIGERKKLGVFDEIQLYQRQYNPKPINSMVELFLVRPNLIAN